MTEPAFALYRAYAFESPLAPDAIWERLEPEFEPLQAHRISLPFQDYRPYEAERTPEGFRFKRLYHKSQYTTPLTHVTLEPAESGTRVHVRVQRTGLSKARVPLASCGIAAALIGIALAASVLEVAFLGPMIVLAGFLNWGIASLTLRSRAREDQTFLESKLAGRS